MKRLILAALAAFAIAVAPVTAAPPQASLAILDPAPYVFGQEITVTTQTSGSKQFVHAWTQFFCYQDEILVGVGGGDLHANDGGSYSDVFTLGPSRSWQGGAASCELRAYVMNPHHVKVVETLAFSVEA